MEIMLTTDEVAITLAVSRETVYRLVRTGKLAGRKVGRGWRFNRADVLAFQAAPVTV